MSTRHWRRLRVSGALLACTVLIVLMPIVTSTASADTNIFDVTEPTVSWTPVWSAPESVPAWPPDTYDANRGYLVWQMGHGTATGVYMPPTVFNTDPLLYGELCIAWFAGSLSCPPGGGFGTSDSELPEVGKVSSRGVEWQPFTDFFEPAGIWRNQVHIAEVGTSVGAVSVAPLDNGTADILWTENDQPGRANWASIDSSGQIGPVQNFSAGSAYLGVDPSFCSSGSRSVYVETDYSGPNSFQLVTQGGTSQQKILSDQGGTPVKIVCSGYNGGILIASLVEDDQLNREIRISRLADGSGTLEKLSTLQVAGPTDYFFFDKLLGFDNISDSDNKSTFWLSMKRGANFDYQNPTNLVTLSKDQGKTWSNSLPIENPDGGWLNQNELGILPDERLGLFTARDTEFTPAVYGLNAPWFDSDPWFDADPPRRDGSDNAKAFTPLIYQDSSEKYPLTDPDWFLSQHCLSDCGPDVTPLAFSQAENLFSFSPSERLYPELYPELDILLDRSFNFEKPDEDSDTRAPGKLPKLFVNEIPPGQEMAYTFYDYWWYFGFNEGTNPGGVVKYKYNADHLSDWEGVSVAARPGQSKAFDFVSFASHESRYTYLPGVLRCGDSHFGTEEQHTTSCTGETRVNVYVAEGQHASYPRRCDGKFLRTDCRQSAAPKGAKIEECTKWIGDKCFLEGKFDGNFGDTMQNVRLKKYEKAFDGDWTAWPGKWSEDVDAPPLQTRFNSPLGGRVCIDRWEQGGDGRDPGNLIDCDYSLDARPSALTKSEETGFACEPWFGPSVSAAACIPKKVETAIREGTVGNSGSIAVEAPGEDADSAPGIAQLSGFRLAPDQTVTVTSRVGEAADLRVRGWDRGLESEALFKGLRLPKARNVKVSMSKKGKFLARVPGVRKPIKPTATRSKLFVVSKTPRITSAVLRGRNLEVKFRARRFAAVSVELLGKKSKPIRRIVRRTGRKRISVRLTGKQAKSLRKVRLQLYSDVGVSKRASKPIRRRSSQRS